MNKKLVPSFRFQLADYRFGILIYYTVVLSLLALTFFTALLHKGVVISSGASAASVVFLFVCGLCAFKENFGMSLQNGVSRRTMFTARLCVTVGLSAGMAILDEALSRFFGFLGEAFLKDAAVYSTLFDQIFQGGWSFGEVLLLSVTFNFVLCLAASAIGYFITLMFYRLNKLGKILVGAGVPVFFMVVPPVLEVLDNAFFGEVLQRIARRVIGFLLPLLFGGVPNVIGTCFALFLVFSLFAWLLLRKAVVK